MSVKIIFFGLFSMIAAAVLLFFDTATLLAYAGLVIGFFAVGIGILLGFYRMVTDDGDR